MVKRNIGIRFLRHFIKDNGDFSKQKGRKPQIFLKELNELWPNYEILFRNKFNLCDIQSYHSFINEMYNIYDDN